MHTSNDRFGGPLLYFFRRKQKDCRTCLILNTILLLQVLTSITSYSLSPNCLCRCPSKYNLSFSMLFSLLPSSFINFTIRPSKCALTMFLSVFVISLIFLTIRPCENTIPMGLSHKPSSFIISSIIKVHNSFIWIKIKIPWNLSS